MADRQTAEEKLAHLREMILNARSMPMSASCVINRGDVLAAVDDVIENLPDEIADAQRVIDRAQARIAEGEAEAGRILAEAREHAARLAQHTEVVRVAEEFAGRLRSEAQGGGCSAAAGDRRVHRLPDGRFQSVLYKTASQVRAAPHPAGGTQRARWIRSRHVGATAEARLSTQFGAGRRPVGERRSRRGQDPRGLEGLR